MTIKEKVEKQMPLIGGHTNLNDAIITELYGELGYDFVWIDMEHTALMPQQVYHHILAAKSTGTAAFVRVPVDDLTNTKKILEMDIDGIIFPMVRDSKHAKALLDNTLYPPVGTRGCGPKGAVRYGLESEADFYVNGHKKICRFVQIELESAALDAEAIANIPYLDGCILGMHDLSGSIGRLGDVFCEENLALANRAIKAFKDAGKTVGVATFATDEATLKKYHDMGINMICTGADYVYVIDGAKKTMETLKNVRGEN